MNQGSRVRVLDESHGRLAGPPPAGPSRVSELESADSAGPQVLAGCGGSGDHSDGIAVGNNEDVAMGESASLKRGRDDGEDDDFITPNKQARVEPSPSESGLFLTNFFGFWAIAN